MRKARSKLYAAFLAFALVGCLSVVAHAQSDEAVAAMVKQADEHIAAKEFEDAVFLLREAYKLGADPDVLHKLALAYEGLGGREGIAGARDAYRLYLDNKADVEDRALIEERIGQLDKQLADIERKEKAEADRRAAADEQQSTLDAFLAGPVPRVFLGVGWSGLFASVSAGVVAIVVRDKADDKRVHKNAKKLQDVAEAFVTVANISMAAGIVLTAAGTTFITLDLTIGSSSGGDNKAQLQVRPTGAAFSVSF